MTLRGIRIGMLGLSLTLPAVAQQAPSTPAPDFARQPFVIERYFERIRYEENGTGRNEVDARVRIQSESAVQAFGQLEFPYDSSSQRLVVDLVRVLKATGDTVLAPPSAVQDLTGLIAREAPVFSDLRVKVVTVPGLRPGDVLEYRVSWTTHAPLAPGHFWTEVAFTRDAIVLDQRLTLDVPRGKYVLVRTVGLAQPDVADADGRRTQVWRHANLRVDTSDARTAARGRRPGDEPPSVQITTFRNWEEVGRWYAGLEREREAPTAAIRARAESLVRGKTSFQDSVAALYDYVGRETRYVSLSFGIGRYQPHFAADVLANQYGDCKDKHTLLASLLRAVGIASAPVLIATGAPVDSTVPSPGQFDHLITYVQGRRDTLWLDATPGVAPFRFLFSSLRGQQALVVPLDAPARLRRTPEAPLFPEFDRVMVDGQLSEAGRLTATVSRTERGESEVMMRALFRSLPEERIAWLAQQVAAEEGMEGTVSAVRASDPGATRDPLELTYHLDRAGAIEWTGLRARYRPPLPPFTTGEDDSSATPDTLVLPLGEQTRRLRLLLPPGVTAELPVAVATANDFGDYRATYQVRDNAILVERLLVLKQRRLPPARASELAAFRRAVRDDEAQSVTLTRGDSPATARAGGDVAPLYQAALAAYDRRDYSGSVRLLRQVLARDARHRSAWIDLGRAYFGIGQLDSAGACFRRQIALDPYDRYAYNDLGLVLWRSHRPADAAASFRQQIQVTPLDRYAHANLGALALENHWDSVAVAELRTAAGIAPNVVGLHLNLALAYLAAGQADAAVGAFDRAIELRPLPDVLNGAADTLAAHGVRLDKAEAYSRAAIDSTVAPLRNITLDAAGPLEMDAVSTLAHLWATRGWISFRTGDFAVAERYLRASWLLDTGRGAIADRLGQTLERLGRRADAIDAYALALATDDSLPETRVRLAALAGGTARVQRLVNDAHGRLQAGRAVRITRTTRLTGSGIVRVLLGPGPRVEDVRFDGGAENLRPLEEAIRAAAAAFPAVFPDTTTLRLPLRGLLACSPASGCSIVLLEPRMGQPPTDAMGPPQE